MSVDQRSKSKAQNKKPKRKTNLLSLSSKMNKYCVDAVDKEYLRRFRMVIESVEEDITKVMLNNVLKDPNGIDPNAFTDALQPYIKHFVFMLKRLKKKAPAGAKS